MEDAASIGTSMSASVESYAPDFSPAATELLDAPLERTLGVSDDATERRSDVQGSDVQGSDAATEARSDDCAASSTFDEGVHGAVSGPSARRRSRRRGKAAPIETSDAVAAGEPTSAVSEVIAESPRGGCESEERAFGGQIAPQSESADLDPVAQASEVDATPAAQHCEPLPERIIEAILFSSDSPVMPARLADVAGLEDSAAAVECVEKLNAQYAALGLAFRIEKIARGYQMLTMSSYQPYLARLHQQAGESRLSDAALETLSIVAYKQPIIRADVEAIRGVAAGDGINRLRAMGLVKIVGRAEIVGRPILYGTTKKFLDMFGLADLNDLPPLEALRVRPATKPEATPIEQASGEPRADAMVA